MKAPKELYFNPNDLSKPYTKGQDLDGREMDVYCGITAWSSPANPVIKECRYVNVSKLWHDGNMEPMEKGTYLIDAKLIFEGYHEEDCVTILTTADWDKIGWSTDNIPGGAISMCVRRWMSISKLI